MPIDLTTVSQINPITWTGVDAKLSWSGTSTGLTWQVYVNRSLIYHGTNTYCFFPWPADGIQIDIGSVDPADAGTDFSASLPQAPFARAELLWQGGNYLDPGDGIGGFYVYGEATPGGGVNYTTPLANIPAYAGSIVTDGFGLGGFGGGGFGMAAADYSWVSQVLASGTWTFAVKAYDKAGNLGPAATQVVTIALPPQEPPPFPGGTTRLKYQLVSFGEGGFGAGGYGWPEVILTWLASTG